MRSARTNPSWSTRTSLEAYVECTYRLRVLDDPRPLSPIELNQLVSPSSCEQPQQE